MKNFKETFVQIGLSEIPCLIDTNNIKWYPLNTFFKRALYRPCEVSSYRDSQLSNYMQVIEYKFQEQRGLKELKTWFMNETGIKIILKNIKTAPTNNSLMKLRQQGLYDACLYFNIKREEPIITQYSNMITNFEKYELFDRICLETDSNIKTNTTWKRCDKCNIFYPDNKNYFPINSKNNTKITCKKCNKEDFTIVDNEVNKLYKIGGKELVIAVYNKYYIKALKIINNSNVKFAPKLFYEKDILIKLIYYIQKNKNGDMENFNLRYMSKYINIPLPDMKKIIGSSINIGYLKALPEDYEKSTYLNEFKIKNICKQMFGYIIQGKNIPFPEIEPILGIITKKGLIIICKKPTEISNIKTFQFYKEPKKMNRILKKIKGWC